MKYIVILVTALLVLSCSGEPPTPSIRPGGDPDNPSAVDDNALAAELKDAQPRVVTGTVTILYNFGGVIMGRDKTGSMYTIDVENGTRIDFNPAACTLSINDISQHVTSVKKAKEVDGTSWYVIDTTAGRVIYVTRF